MTTFTGADWMALFVHFASLSLLAVGGAITTAPAMHRYLVTERMWLTNSEFTTSIALAQAAPGPNVLFVALLGWQVGLHAAGSSATTVQSMSMAAMGMGVTMLGILLPSTTLTFLAARWGHQNRELRAVRAFKQAMAPIVIALLIATGWILVAGHGGDSRHWPLWLLAALSALVVWKTRIHLLWLLGFGAIAGALGWV
jgi:chromate transporter